MKKISALLIALILAVTSAGCVSAAAFTSSKPESGQTAAEKTTDSSKDKDDQDSSPDKTGDKADSESAAKDDSEADVTSDANDKANDNTKDNTSDGAEDEISDTDDPSDDREDKKSEISDDVSENFKEWNTEAPALQTLVGYVETVTDEASRDYIPVKDRIAVFDMDGTLYGELFPTYFEYLMYTWRVFDDPSFEPTDEMIEVAETIRENAIDKSFPKDMPLLHANAAAAAYAGLTQNEFSDLVKEFMKEEADGFEGMTYGEGFYLPMLEVIDYLDENDFKVYIVTGSDRDLSRTLFEESDAVPFENVIGMDVDMAATGQGDTDGLDYLYADGDSVVRTDKLLIKNLKMNKVKQIVREIGKQPVLSFGNSSGDSSMHNYTIFDNPYKSEAFMLIADDEERDYGNEEKGEELRKEWENAGYQVISMKDDFRTIYGEDVKKTGTFEWEDLKNEKDSKSEAEEKNSDKQNTSAEESKDSDIRYVMYLGTNDKDTNERVFSRSVCKEKAKEILMKHFGGYTIQEAESGWVDDNGKEYQQYTLVITLCDTTLDIIHEAADELKEVFHQSAVLIQENPTTAEFR